jgi:hypothetical protein
MVSPANFPSFSELSCQQMYSTSSLANANANGTGSAASDTTSGCFSKNRFYESPFRPKTFWTHFCSQILKKINPNINHIEIYLAFVGNNL